MSRFALPHQLVGLLVWHCDSLLQLVMWSSSHHDQRIDPNSLCGQLSDQTCVRAALGTFHVQSVTSETSFDLELHFYVFTVDNVALEPNWQRHFRFSDGFQRQTGHVRFGCGCSGQDETLSQLPSAGLITSSLVCWQLSRLLMQKCR